MYRSSTKVDGVGPESSRVRYATWTTPPNAATSGVKWLRPPPGGSAFTLAGRVHVAPSFEDCTITTSLWWSVRNRLSCHATNSRLVAGSTAAVGRPPVRIPGSDALRSFPTVAGEEKVRPPSEERWARMAWPEELSHTSTRSPFGSTSGRTPTPLEPGGEASMAPLHVCPRSSEYRTS